MAGSLCGVVAALMPGIYKKMASAALFISAYSY